MDIQVQYALFNNHYSVHNVGVDTYIKYMLLSELLRARVLYSKQLDRWLARSMLHPPPILTPYVSSEAFRGPINEKKTYQRKKLRSGTFSAHLINFYV